MQKQEKLSKSTSKTTNFTQTQNKIDDKKNMMTLKLREHITELPKFTAFYTFL